jgi:hypothetical protein
MNFWQHSSSIHIEQNHHCGSQAFAGSFLAALPVIRKATSVIRSSQKQAKDQRAAIAAKLTTDTAYSLVDS